MGKVIQFRTRENWEKEKREKVWLDWLEWEKWEDENIERIYSDRIDVQDTEPLDGNVLSLEKENFLNSDAQIARNGRMRIVETPTAKAASPKTLRFNGWDS